MNNSKSGLVGILSFIALTAASLGLLGAASRTAGASQDAGRALVAVVRDAGEPTVTTVWTVDEVTITPAPKRAARRAAKAAKATVVTASSDVCYTRELGDGNKTSVRTCTPADMIGL